MSRHVPLILKLAEWATAQSTGRPCDGLTEWLDRRADRAKCWNRVRAALAALDAGEWPATEPLLAPDLVARYLDGECQPGEEADVEQTCWESDADLLEIVSGWRFQQSDADAPVPSAELTQRLLDPQPTPPPIATPPTPPTLNTNRPTFRAHSIVVFAAVVAAAVVMIAGFIGGLRWFGRIGGEGRFPMVKHDGPKGRSPDESPSQPGTGRAIDGAIEQPDVKQIANDPSRAGDARPNDASPDRGDTPKPDRPSSIDPQRAKPESIVDSPRRPVTPIGPND
ncbi:MAG TPA: hypothetical protein PLV92_28845, partial [Pirellulaceae bacterium]|nr:hypothetical protein [Pirellulaceae bacterium]